MAYWDKHVQPSGDSCVGEILTNVRFSLTQDHFFGKWDAERLWRMVGLTHQTGDTQLVVFDLENNRMFVSYSEKGTGLEAYKRRPIEINTAELFETF